MVDWRIKDIHGNKLIDVPMLSFAPENRWEAFVRWVQRDAPAGRSHRAADQIAKKFDDMFPDQRQYRAWIDPGFGDMLPLPQRGGPPRMNPNNDFRDRNPPSIEGSQPKIELSMPPLNVSEKSKSKSKSKPREQPQQMMMMQRQRPANQLLRPYQMNNKRPIPAHMENLPQQQMRTNNNNGSVAYLDRKYYDVDEESEPDDEEEEEKDDRDYIDVDDETEFDDDDDDDENEGKYKNNPIKL